MINYCSNSDNFMRFYLIIIILIYLSILKFVNKTSNKVSKNIFIPTCTIKKSII